MSKQLSTNRFSNAILAEWDDFIVFDFQDDRSLNKPKLKFKWKFHKYSGIGEIDYEGCVTRNTFGDNYSSMTICTPKNISTKQNCSLYNDKGLEEVFNKILINYFGANNT